MGQQNNFFCAGRDGTGTQIEKVNGTGRPFYIPDLQVTELFFSKKKRFFKFSMKM